MFDTPLATEKYKYVPALLSLEGWEKAETSCLLTYLRRFHHGESGTRG